MYALQYDYFSAISISAVVDLGGDYYIVFVK